ncbi:MAG: PKD domain-containing protein [Sphingobacteriaceae bacterium]
MSWLKLCFLKSAFISILLLLCMGVHGQSNEGTDFWVAYTGHVDGTNSRLTLFITSKVDASVNITIGGVPYAGGPVSVQANQSVPVYIDPNFYTNVYVAQTDGTAINHGIHVTATAPIIVYSHISRSARSAATLVLPTKTLGNEYYAMAYNQMASGGGEVRVSEFTVLGVEDNTIVEITLPSGVNSTSDALHIAGSTYQITLNTGDVYQFQSTVDVTGVKIRTIGTCKPVAVFSGSTKSGFCDSPITSNSGTGQDNLYQQLFPITAWGKNYITAPFYNALHGVQDIIRIFVATDNTTISLNGKTGGNVYGLNLSNPYARGSIISFATSEPVNIVSSEPISVAQVQVSESCNPANSVNNPVYPGDPEMTILNPIEQTLTDITVYSAISVPAAPTSITKHYINVILKTADIPNFKLDNSTVQASNFTPINSEYSYLIADVTLSSQSNPTHRIQSTGGFVAIAYGYGHYESYAYLAGASVKNLTQFVSLNDPFSGTDLADGCTAQSLDPEITLPYTTTEIIWDLDNGGPIVSKAYAAPSATIVLADGTPIYKYKYGSAIIYATPGTKNINAKPLNPILGPCGQYDEIKKSFEIYALPIASFSTTAPTCLGGSTVFTNTSTISSGKIISWIWDFADGTTPVVKSDASAVSHIYALAGDYQPKLTVVSDRNCNSPVSSQTVHISALPVAQFTYSTPNCETNVIHFINQSVSAEGTINTYNWDFGDGSNSTESDPNHIFTTAGSYLVKLFVKNDLGCTSLVYSQNIVINALPKVDFKIPDICLDDPQAVFENLSTAADGSVVNLTYAWDFGDSYASVANPNTSTLRNPSHRFTQEGDYIIQLRVTTVEGCSFAITKNFRVNGVNPVADFEVINKDNLCANVPVSFKNKSYVNGFGQITRLEWYFDYLNQPGVFLADENPTSGQLYTHNYTEFNPPPAAKNFTVRLLAYSGGVCVMEAIQVITLKAVPEVTFNLVSEICEEISPFQINPTEKHAFAGNFQFSGPGVNSTGLFSPRLAGVGTHTITCFFNATNGCSDSYSSQITVYRTPTVNAGRDTVILAGGTAQLRSIATGSSLVYRWSPSTGLDYSDIPNPIASPSVDTRYTLLVSSDKGCVAADDIFVKVLQMPEVPSAFTPNGDGKNDVWNIKYLESYEHATVEIFNRYGQKVFSSLGYKAPWDGTQNGVELPVATYYYIITPGNGRKPIVGSLTIIR